MHENKSQDLGREIIFFTNEQKRLLTPPQRNILEVLDLEYPRHPGYFSSLRDYARYLYSVFDSFGLSFQDSKMADVLVPKNGFDICQKLKQVVRPIATESDQNFLSNFSIETQAKTLLLQKLLEKLNSYSSGYPYILEFLRDLKKLFQTEIALHEELETTFGQTEISPLPNAQPDNLHQITQYLSDADALISTWKKPYGEQEATKTEKKATIQETIALLHQRIEQLLKDIDAEPDGFENPVVRAQMENEPDHPEFQNAVCMDIRRYDSLKATLRYLEFLLDHAVTLEVSNSQSSRDLSPEDLLGLFGKAERLFRQTGEITDLPWLGKRDWVPPITGENGNRIFSCNTYQGMDASTNFQKRSYLEPHIPSRDCWGSLPNTTERLFQPETPLDSKYLSDLMELLQSQEMMRTLTPFLHQKATYVSALKYATWARETALIRPDLVTAHADGKLSRSEQLRSLFLSKKNENETVRIPQKNEISEILEQWKQPRIKSLGIDHGFLMNTGTYTVQELTQTLRWGIEQEIYTDENRLVLETYKTLLAYLYRWGDQKDRTAFSLRKDYLQLLSNGLITNEPEKAYLSEPLLLDYFDTFMLLASELELQSDWSDQLFEQSWLLCSPTFIDVYSPEKNPTVQSVGQIKLMLYQTYFRMPAVQRERYATVIEYVFDRVNRLFPSDHSTVEKPIAIQAGSLQFTERPKIDALIQLADLSLLEGIDLISDPAWTNIQVNQETPIIGHPRANELRINAAGQIIHTTHQDHTALVPAERNETLEAIQEKFQLPLSVDERRPDLSPIIQEVLHDSPETGSIETTAQLFTLLEVILGWDLDESQDASLDLTTIFMTLAKLRSTTLDAEFASSLELQEAFQHLKEKSEISLDDLDMGAIIQLILLSAGYADRELILETLFNSLEGIDTVLGLKIVETLEVLETSRLLQWLPKESIPTNQVFTFRDDLKALQTELEQRNSDVEGYNVFEDPAYKTLIEKFIKKLLKLYTGNRSYSADMSSVILSLRKAQRDATPLMSRCNVDGKIVHALLRVMAPQYPSYNSLTYGPGVNLPFSDWLALLARDGEWGQQSHGFCTTGQDTVTAIVDGTMPFGGFLGLKEADCTPNRTRGSNLKWGQAHDVSPSLLQRVFQNPPQDILRMCVRGGSVFAAEAAHQAELPTLISYIANPDHFGIALEYIGDTENPAEKRWQALKKLILHEPKVLGFLITNDNKLGNFLKRSQEIIQLSLSHQDEGRAIAVFVCNILLSNKRLNNSPALKREVLDPIQRARTATITIFASTKETLTEAAFRKKCQPFGHLFTQSDIEDILRENKKYIEKLNQVEAIDLETLLEKVLHEQTEIIEQSTTTVGTAANQVRAAETQQHTVRPTVYDSEKETLTHHLHTQVEEVVLQANASQVFDDTSNRLIAIGSETDPLKALKALTTAPDGTPLLGEPLQQRMAAIQLVLTQMRNFLPGSTHLIPQIQAGFEKTAETVGIPLPFQWAELKTNEGLLQLAKTMQNDPLLKSGK